MNISGVIFDLNGTILDDEELYNIAFNRILKKIGVDTSKEIPHERGVGVKEDWDIYKKQFKLTTKKTSEQLAAETQEEYLKQVEEITVRPGFEELAEGLKDSGIKLALATSNTWEVTMKILEKVGLTDYFDSITTTEEVKFNKPDPDLFIVAADKLGFERNECLVIEDAPSGVEAAHRAGMKVIAISDDEKFSQKLSKADLLIEGFSEITPQAIAEL